MTYTELDHLTREALVVSERNEKISRHIQSARRHIVLMAVALVLLALALYYPAEARPYGPVAIAAFCMGWSLKAVLGHMRRARRHR